MPPKGVKTASIRPSSFKTDSDLPDLSTVSLESVVAQFKDTERKRSPNSEPSEQQEVPWGIRSAPVELLSSLKIVSSELNVSRSVLTKCMSHQIVDWYVNALGLDYLRSEYESIYKKIKLQGYSTLRTQAENPAKFCYTIPTEKVETSLSTIGWVKSKLESISDVIGLSCTDLLFLGFMWSLTTLEHKDWDRRNIERRFMPEVVNLSVVVRDRLADTQALCLKYQYREEMDYNRKVYGG